MTKDEIERLSDPQLLNLMDRLAPCGWLFDHMIYNGSWVLQEHVGLQEGPDVRTAIRQGLIRALKQGDNDVCALAGEFIVDADEPVAAGGESN